MRCYIRCMAKKPTKSKGVMLRIPQTDWEKFRELFDTRFFTDSKAVTYAVNHYASTNTKKLP